MPRYCSFFPIIFRDLTHHSFFWWEISLILHMDFIRGMTHFSLDCVCSTDRKSHKHTLFFAFSDPLLTHFMPCQNLLSWNEFWLIVSEILLIFHYWFSEVLLIVQRNFNAFPASGKQIVRFTLTENALWCSKVIFKPSKNQNNHEIWVKCRKSDRQMGV